MREYTLALGLHMFGLKPDSSGQIKYNGATSQGTMAPQNERVFIKAKGLLYLSELHAKKVERITAFGIGFLTAFLAQYLVEYLRT